MRALGHRLDQILSGNAGSPWATPSSFECSGCPDEMRLVAGSPVPRPSFSGVVRVDSSYRSDTRQLRKLSGKLFDRSLAVNLQGDLDQSSLVLICHISVGTGSRKQAELLGRDLSHDKAGPGRTAEDLPEDASTIEVANADDRDDAECSAASVSPAVRSREPRDRTRLWRIRR